MEPLSAAHCLLFIAGVQVGQLHGNVCYYSQIILNSLPLLLFSELQYVNKYGTACKQQHRIEDIRVSGIGKSKDCITAQDYSNVMHC